VRNKDVAPSVLRLRVLFYNIIADHVEKRSEALCLPAGSKVSDLLEWLAAKYPAFERYVRDITMLSDSPLRLFRNGHIVLDAAECVANGDEIRIFPIISGG
jgi:molybdopterin converting factor small subunit